ncbi:MAG: hypothetical protein ABW275_07450 [Hansschlegelia sp.]
MVSVVNGYVCSSSCDEDVARKGHDPRNPKDNPAKAEMLAIRDGKQVETKRVSFGEDSSTVKDGAAPTEQRRAASPALVFDVSV